jgi:putative flippase GtrA
VCAKDGCGAALFVVAGRRLERPHFVVTPTGREGDAPKFKRAPRASSPSHRARSVHRELRTRACRGKFLAPRPYPARMLMFAPVAEPCIDPSADVGSGLDELSYDSSSTAPERRRVDPRNETIAERVKRFLRSSAVGILATVLDMATLGLFVSVFHWDHTLAKIPALTIGTSTQFIGSRYYAFRAQRGKLGRQMKWFVFAEFCAFWLTVFVFHAMDKWLHIPTAIANLASGSVVYFGFSYPIWNRVFTLRPDELGPAATALDASPATSADSLDTAV